MRNWLWLVLLAAAAPAWAQDGKAVAAAASQFAGDIVWRPASVLDADFSCSGKTEHAILGTSLTEIVVGIFTDGLARPPALVRFTAQNRHPLALKINLEANDLRADELQEMAGDVPSGYQVRPDCFSVRLSDDQIDAVHIYWDHTNRQFGSWSQ